MTPGLVIVGCEVRRHEPGGEIGSPRCRTRSVRVSLANAWRRPFPRLLSGLAIRTGERQQGGHRDPAANAAAAAVPDRQAGPRARRAGFSVRL